MRLSRVQVVLWCLPIFAQRPVVVSPEVGSDRRVTFRLWAPTANDVQLSGDWMGPRPPVALAKGDNGIWAVTAGPFAPNIYTYGFLVDGVRASDPACRCTLAWAHRAASSEFLIPGPTPEPWEVRASVSKGTLHTETYFSARQQRARRFVVYTPPGYGVSIARNLPVLVLLPGTPGDENDWTSGGGFAETIFDNLIADRRMLPMVVVMHASDVLANGKRAENLKEFEPMLMEEIVPEIRRRYRVAQSPELWAIAGLSLGGEFAMTVGLRHPERFRSVASISGSMVERDFDDRFGKVFANPAAFSRQRLLWIGCGTDDIFFGGNKALAARLTAAGMRNAFAEFPGFHAMPVFRRELVALLPKLFR